MNQSRSLYERLIVALTLILIFGCSGGSGSTSASSTAPVGPQEPTLQSEIQKINSELNQGSSVLSKEDFNALVQEGALEGEDADLLRPFVQE